MRKTFRLIPLFVLAVSFSTPFFAFAGSTLTGYVSNQPNGASCLSANNCTSGYCDANNICASNPAAHGLSNQPNGASCLSATDCASGYCDANNICASNAQSLPSAGGSGSGITNTFLPSSGSGGIDTSYLQGYATSIIDIINGLIVPTLLAIAFLFFVWGAANYFIFGAANETKREVGRQFILWSIIGFVVIFSVWGLVGLVGSTLNLSPGGSAPSYPTL